jgi:ectoine hydroxylase-related dioxygenase (phytanoyl-CoA dioxygenase family)
MVTEIQREQFRRDGYFILDGIFNQQEIDELEQHIDRFVEAHERELQAKGASGISRPNEISFTWNLTAQDPVIQSFATQQRFVDLTKDLLGNEVSLYWDQSVYKKPETPREFPWHQDNGYVPVKPEEYLTCWLALEDATVENGCIWVLPGSHQQGLVEHKDTPIGKQGYLGEDEGTAVPLKKGSMVVFSSLLLHRSGPNLSNTTRKAYILQYTPADARHGETGEPFNRLLVVHEGQATHGQVAR